MRGRRFLFALGLLAFTIAAAAAAVGPAGAQPTTVAGPNASAELGITYDVDTLPNDSDRIELAVDLHLDGGAIDDLSDYRLELGGANVTVLAADGMARVGSTVLWTGTARNASIRLQFDPRVENWRFEGVDTGAGDDWALLSMEPQVRGDIVVEETFEPDGHRGEALAFIGAHQRYTHTTHGQAFTLIVPAVAEPRAAPAAILDALAFHAAHLRVDSRQPRIHVFATTAPLRAGGVAMPNNREFSVRADTSLARNTWGHEYVHTRQDRWMTQEMRWLTEAEAAYYAELFAWKQGHHGSGASAFERLRGRLSLHTQAHDDVILSDPATWTAGSDYRKGALVLFALDAAIRNRTDGTRSYQDVMRRLNTHEAPIDGATFRAILVEVAGAPMDGFLDAYVHGTAVPDGPSREHFAMGAPAYDVAFDVDLALEQAVPKALPSQARLLRGAPVAVHYRIEHVGADTSVAPQAAIDLPAGWRRVRGNPPRAALPAALHPGEAVNGTMLVEPTGDAVPRANLSLSVEDADGFGDEATRETRLAEHMETALTATDAQPFVRPNASVRLDADVGGHVARYGWDLTGTGRIDVWTERSRLDRPLPLGTHAVAVYAIGDDGRVGTDRTAVTVNDAPALGVEATRRVLDAGEVPDGAWRLVTENVSDLRDGSHGTASPAGVLRVRVADHVGDIAVAWRFPDGTVHVATDNASLARAMIPQDVTARHIVGFEDGRARLDIVPAFEPGYNEVEVVAVDAYGLRRAATITIVLPNRRVAPWGYDAFGTP